MLEGDELWGAREQFLSSTQVSPLRRIQQLVTFELHCKERETDRDMIYTTRQDLCGHSLSRRSLFWSEVERSRAVLEWQLGMVGSAP